MSPTRTYHQQQQVGDQLGHRRTCASVFAAAVAVTLVVAGCSADLHSPESVLSPAGPQAQHIRSLAWLYMGVCLVVYILVMLFLIGAFLHRRHGKAMEPGNDHFEPEPASEQRIWRVVFAAIGVTVLTLFALLIGDFATGRSLALTSTAPDPLRIQIIGHQWWWEVHYVDWPERFGERVASNNITTANEIHIPVDPNNPVTVQFMLESHDVIHSFWVPSLDGKKDLVPGHPTTLWLQADQPGTYWGECAEYCGYQHANMRLVVVAEPVDQFQTWLNSQRQSAPDPTNAAQERGRHVFLGSSCVMCHSIQGLPANGRVGPDLTHVASRKLLAAGALQNSRGDVSGWIVDPQRIKPGTQMPQNNLAPEDLRALLDYIETLK